MRIKSLIVIFELTFLFLSCGEQADKIKYGLSEPLPMIDTISKSEMIDIKEDVPGEIDSLILLNGFQKKTEKTPKSEIEKAQKLMKGYYEEKG
jgi:hypothetical protein